MLGAGAVLIQREKIGEPELATYWAFEALQALAAALIVIAVTPFAVDVSMQGRALRLGLLVAISVLLPGITNPGRILAEREARFERISFLESVGATTELLVVLGIAIWLRSAAALAIGALARAAMEVAGSYALFPLAPRPALHREPAREYLRASAHFIAISAGGYIMIYGDNLTVANQLGTVALGFYVAAHRLTELAFATLTSVANRVVFPVLSRLRGGDPRFLASVAMLIELQLLYLGGVAAGLVGFAAFWVRSFYGAPFAPATVVLEALFFVMTGRAISRMTTPIILATGRYDFTSKVKGIEAALFMLGVVIGVKTAGIVGVALGAGVGYVVAAGLRLEFLRRHIGIRGLSLARMLGTTTAISCVSLAIARGLGPLTVPLGRWGGALQIATYSVVFCLVALVTRGPLLRTALGVLRSGLGPAKEATG